MSTSMWASAGPGGLFDSEQATRHTDAGAAGTAHPDILSPAALSSVRDTGRFGFAPGSSSGSKDHAKPGPSGSFEYSNANLMPKPGHMQSWLFQPHIINAPLLAREALDTLERAVSSSLAAGGMYEGDQQGMKAPHTRRLVQSVAPSHAAIRYVTSADVLALLANYLLVEDASVVERIVRLLDQLLSAATSALDASELAAAIHASGIVPVMLLRIFEWAAPPLNGDGVPDEPRRMGLAIQAAGMLRALVRACADGIDTVAVSFDSYGADDT